VRILIVTGKLAEPLIKDIVSKTKTVHKVDVISLPITVAALASTELIARNLKALGIRKGMYDLILIPGYSQGSAKIIEETIGIPAVKGTLHAYDIPVILSLEDPLKILSSEKPADEIIKNEILRLNKSILIDLEKAVDSKEHIIIGNVKIPIDPPPIRIIAEISDCHLMSVDDILNKAHELIEKGADIISLGFEAGNPHSDLVYKVIKYLRKHIRKPIAIDSIIPSEIKSAIQAGVDMVLSIEYGNIEHVYKYISEVPVVLIPYDSRTNYLPKNPLEKVGLLSKLIDKARNLGIKTIIADPILEPPIVRNTFSSLLAYKMLKEKIKDIPLLAGIGNVTELIDADSHGVNALLTILLLEIGVPLFLVVEKSTKAQDSVRETKIAAQMASLALMRKTPPKDLGIDLLILKDKRREITPLEKEGAVIVNAKEEYTYEIDPMGIFKIRVNYTDRVIEALYIGRKGKILIRGKTARAIQNMILKMGLVSKLSHAFYLGIELSKAEEALRLKKNYIQEKPLFSEKQPIKLENDLR